MLAGVPKDPLSVVGVLSPRQGEATVHAIAVNAVMAGCRPAQLPIVVAAIVGLADPAFNLPGVNATTHPCGVFVLGSGPAARAAGLHGGAGCFGPAHPANVAIGTRGAAGAAQRRGRDAGEGGSSDAGHARQAGLLRHGAGRTPAPGRRSTRRGGCAPATAP